MEKKWIIVITASVLVVVLTIALSLVFTRYQWDPKDTEELYRENVAKVGYENTFESALPQTGLYDLINAHFASPLEEGKTVKKAIIIGYDGCRADILTEMEEGKSGIKSLLNEGGSLHLSYCGGVNYPEKNTQDTSTAPGWCSILTGEWAEVHGVNENYVTKSMATKTLLTSLVENGVADSSSFITKWKGHFTKKNATYLEEKEYAKNNNLAVNYLLAKNDEDSLRLANEELRKENCSDFLFVIYEPTDATGHSKGFSHNNPKYQEAFKTADEYGYTTIETIKNRATYLEEDWLIIITSDHGGKKVNHGKASIQERYTFQAVLS